MTTEPNVEAVLRGSLKCPIFIGSALCQIEAFEALDRLNDVSLYQLCTFLRLPYLPPPASDLVEIRKAIRGILTFLKNEFREYL